jgi:dephospho-CoA kinase
MLLVGLTGGIGSGKTTVAELLRAKGAVILDADEYARRAVEAGSPALARVVERFGPEVLAADGSLDRERMAAVAFADPSARTDLEAIVHPEVARLFSEDLERYRGTDEVVVYVVPLLAERGLQDLFDVVVGVSAPEDLRVDRLRARGMAEDDARARIAAQLPEHERLAVADIVVANRGSLAGLEAEVDRLWAELGARRNGPEAGR